MKIRTTALLCFLSGMSNAFATDIPTGADTGINTSAAQQDNTAGNAVQIPVQSPSQIALIRFPQAQLPPKASSATLKVAITSVFTAGQVSAHLITSDWREATVTGRTRPNISSTPLDTKNITTANRNGTIEFNISAAVSQWISNPASNFGIALMGAASPRTYIVVRTKESGAPSLLAVVGGVPMNNVTVALSGGDYSNPITAADNAYSGDRWCTSPTFEKPCSIKIKQGIYILPRTFSVPQLVDVTGDGQGKTRLIAARGLETAVELYGNTLTDLSITTDQPGLAFAQGIRSMSYLTLNRVDLVVSNALVNYGAYPTEGYSVSNSVIDVSGGQRALALLGSETSAHAILNSRISAHGATEDNIGSTLAFNTFGNITGSTITAIAPSSGGDAVAISALGSESGTTIQNSKLDASAPNGTAIGLRFGLNENTRRVLDSEIVAVGKTGYGLQGYEGGGIEVHIDQSRIFGSTYGVTLPSFTSDVSTITNSVIRSDGIALANSSNLVSFSADVTGTQLLAPTALRTTDDVTFGFSDTVFGGSIIGGRSRLTCLSVYDKNFVRIEAGCPQ